MLTHVDICTALWDYALGHISCNDENDDGDEDSGEGGGGASIFCPCLFFNINQRSEKRWSNWLLFLGWMCRTVTSIGLSLDRLPFDFLLSIAAPQTLLSTNINDLHQV